MDVGHLTPSQARLPRARVLVLAPKVPADGISGDRIRNYHLIRSLYEAGWSVRLFSLSSGDDGEQALLERVAPYCEAVEVFRDGSRLTRRIRMATAILRGDAYHRRLLVSRAAVDRLRRWTQDVSFDVVLVAQLHMVPYVQDWWRPIMVLDSHNDEASRVDGIAAVGGSWLRRLLASAQRSPVRKYEDAAVATAALTLAVSPLELERFEAIAPGRVALVPNGVDVDAVRPVVGPPASNDAVFVGSLDYSANVDAVRYFVAEIAPRITNADCRFLVVGSNPPRGFGRRLRGPIATEVMGYVEDLGQVMKRARVFVVPLRRGGGTRLKVLDAMARGVPVVSTSIGCAGIDVAPGRDLLVGDEPDAFASAIERLLEDDRLWMTLSRRARHRVEAQYAWTAIGKELDSVLKQIVREVGTSATCRSS